MGKKFDFENIDVKLYLALKALIVLAEEEAQSLVYLGREDDATQEAANNAEHLVEQAVLALEEFELFHGPLPDWAIARNWGYELVPGAQLMTKDGRRTGNAHILRQRQYPTIQGGPAHYVYDCITDAGSYIQSISESEILDGFWIGDYISQPETLISRFGNKDEDYGLPQQGDHDV